MYALCEFDDAATCLKKVRITLLVRNQPNAFVRTRCPGPCAPLWVDFLGAHRFLDAARGVRFDATDHDTHFGAWRHYSEYWRQVPWCYSYVTLRESYKCEIMLDYRQTTMLHWFMAFLPEVDFQVLVARYWGYDTPVLAQFCYHALP